MLPKLISTNVKEVDFERNLIEIKIPDVDSYTEMDSFPLILGLHSGT